MKGTLDMQIVNELVEIMGDDIGMLFDTFIMDSESKLDELNIACDSPEADLIRRIAHSLKGSSKNVGAAQLADYCAELEDSARAGDLSQLTTQFESIKTSFEDTKLDIQAQSLSS